MLNVLFISPHSDPEASLGEPDAGGQCVYENELAKALSNVKGIKVTTYCRQTFRRPDISIVNEKYIIKRIECGPKKFVPKEEIEKYLNEFSRKVIDDLREIKNEIVVHSHYWDGAKASLLIKANIFRKLPLVWTPHSLGYLKRKRFKGKNQESFFNFIPRLVWENYMVLAAERLIVSTKEERDILFDEYGLDSNTAFVIAPGINVERLKKISKTKARKKYALPLKSKIILTFGRLSRNKGYQHAIRALYALIGSVENLCLVIWGGSEKDQSLEERTYKRQLIRLAEDLNVSDKVIFKDAVSYEEAYYVYNCADIFLMTSYHEPFGLTALEAMYLEVPVISNNKGGPVSFIDDGKNGLLVDIENPIEVAKGIKFYFDNFQKTKEIVKRAKKNVKEAFSWDKKAKDFLRIYRQARNLEEPYSFRLWVNRNYFLKNNLKLNNL